MEKAKIRLTKFIPLLLLIFLVAPAMLPLFKSGFFTMHDDQQIVRLYELDRALAAGQFPARWVGNLGFGYGYPLFIFYPPLVYYLGEIFHLLFGATFITSIKLVFAFAFLGAAFAMYTWAKEHFGKLAGLVAAAFYTYVPYHAVDAYVRGALAELTSFVWLPAILWSTDRLIYKTQKKYWMWLGVFLALLMITHNLIFLPFLPLFLIYIGFLLYKSKDKPLAIRHLLYAALLAAGLSAFFWLPALAEKRHTLVDNILLSELAEYKLHFVYPTQLWNSLWGYGGSTEGPLDGMSFKIGKLHIVLSIMAIVVWALITRLRRDRKSREKLFYCFSVSLLFIASSLMTTQFSQPIWDLVTPIQYLQFPWRFLTFTALFSSFLVAGLIAAIISLTKNKLLISISALFVVILLLYPNLKLFKAQTFLDVGDDHYLSDRFIKWEISKTSFEFVPKGVKTTTEWNEIEEREITQVDISFDRISGGDFPYRILSGSPEIEIKKNVPGELVLQLQSSPVVSTKLELNIFDFPGWKVYIDGKKVEHTSENDLKLINVNIPGGEHMLKVEFKNTPIRTLANLITLLSTVVIVSFIKRTKKD
jgi:hypothetical protein